MLINAQMLERAGIEVAGDWDDWLPPVRIDSRDIAKGDLFWALEGTRTDGHQFVADAFAAGAQIAAVSEAWAAQHAGSLPAGKVLFVMADTLAGIQNLAREVRRSLGCHTVAVTGSNGKTMTRELIAAALGTMGRTTSAERNLNNHIGLPMTILNATGDEEYLVLEMGANHLREIEFLCRIGYPEFGLITNIADAHAGEFGGFDAIQRAKGELFAFLAETNGAAIVNLEDERVLEEAARVNRKAGYTLGEIPAGWTATVYPGELVALDHWSRPSLRVEGETVSLQLPGRHWARAGLAAAAVAMELGGEPGTFLPALATVEPLPGRGRVIELGEGVELLDDSYNSNVASLEAALATLARRTGKKLAVLGDILELGQFEEDEHRRVGRIPELDEIDTLIFVGPRMSWAAEEATLLAHPDVRGFSEIEPESLADIVRDALTPGTSVLVKGSRLTGLDRFVAELARK